MWTAAPSTWISWRKKRMRKLLLCALALLAGPLHALQPREGARLPPQLTALEVYENVLKAQKQQASLECQIVREEMKAGGAAQGVTGTLRVASGGKAWLEMTVPSRRR